MPRTRPFLLACVLALTACSGPLAADAPGDVIYADSCAPCHGKRLQGRSGPPLGGANAPSAQEDEAYFINTVTKGRSRMPSFEGRLSDEQIARVVAYVMSRQDRPGE